MFETVCVAVEFEFFQFWDVFDISDPKIPFGLEITLWVCPTVWIANCVCHITFCNVSRSINKHFLWGVSFSNNKSMLYHGNTQGVNIGWCSPILALVYFSSNTHSFQS